MGSPGPSHNNGDVLPDSNSVQITGFEVMNRAKFTVFKLRIENEKLGESWLVFRRYTDFVRLHGKLKEEYPTLNCSLPPKRWLRDNYELGFLEDRMKMLQSFVDTILLDEEHNLIQSPIVREFFCLDEPPSNPESSSEESRSVFGAAEENILHLKQQLTERDLECQILKTELALVTAQRDSLLKTTKSCRHCSQRVSVVTPSTISDGRSHRHSTSSRNDNRNSRNDNRNRNSSSSASSLTSNENSVNNSPKTSTPKTSIPKPDDSTQGSALIVQNEASQSVIESDASDTVNEIAVNSEA